jgi:Flp pilus assembly protein TadB
MVSGSVDPVAMRQTATARTDRTQTAPAGTLTGHVVGFAAVAAAVVVVATAPAAVVGGGAVAAVAAGVVRTVRRRTRRKRGPPGEEGVETTHGTPAAAD